MMRGKALFEEVFEKRLKHILKSLQTLLPEERARLLAVRLSTAEEQDPTWREAVKNSSAQHPPLVLLENLWPNGLASTLSVLAAQEAILKLQQEMVKAVRDELWGTLQLLIPPEYRLLLEDRRDLAELWPWPARPQKNPGFFSLALLVEHDLLPPMAAGVAWPTEAAPLEVAAWLLDVLDRRETPKGLKELRTKIIELSHEGRLQNTPLTWEDERESYTLPPGGLGLLFLAELRFRERRPAAFDLTLISTERAMRRTASSMAGAHPELLSEKAKLRTPAESSTPIRLEFTWEDGEELIVSYESSASPLLAIAHKYGPAAVKHLLALFAFSFAARAKAGEGFWWWPSEHLDLLGMSPSKENHAALSRWLSAMQHSTLRAESHSGRKLKASIVTQVMDVDEPENAPDYAIRLHLHPSLYKGITDHEGKPGNHWWPIPMELLKLPANHANGRVHVLAPALSAMFRAGLQKGRGDKAPTAKISAKRLADYLALHKEIDRDKDPHVAEVLRRTLETAKETGLIGEWLLEGGSLDLLTGNLLITPGASALSVINTGRLPKPAYLPSTNGDLKEWVALQKRPMIEIAKLLDVSDRTLRNAIKDGPLYPLTPTIRSALRRYLWRKPDEPIDTE